MKVDIDKRAWSVITFALGFAAGSASKEGDKELAAWLLTEGGHAIEQIGPWREEDADANAGPAAPVG